MKRLPIMLLAVLLCAACTKSELTDDAPQVNGDSVTVKTKKFTFTLKGDFTSEWKAVNKIARRGYLAADGKDITDVWVLDYVDGALVQQLHQDDNTAEDFGKPTMNLAYGAHQVYFIASRGVAPVLDTDAHTITFGNVRDTFWKDYEVNVVSTSNGNRAVTLDRVVTKLKLVFSDAIPTNAATFNVTPTTWYYGWDYINAAPTASATSQTVTINIPSTSIGVVNESVNLFGFSTATEWTADVTLNAKTSGNEVIGSASLTAVPFKANRVSEFTGPLFGSEGGMTLSLNTSWNTSYTGTW